MVFVHVDALDSGTAKVFEQHATQYEWTIAPFRKVMCGKPTGNVPGVNSGHVGSTLGLFDSYSVNLGLRHSR
jgi:hypothetical protein